MVELPELLELPELEFVPWFELVPEFEFVPEPFCSVEFLESYWESVP